MMSSSPVTPSTATISRATPFRSSPRKTSLSSWSSGSSAGGWLRQDHRAVGDDVGGAAMGDMVFAGGPGEPQWWHILSDISQKRKAPLEGRKHPMFRHHRGVLAVTGYRRHLTGHWSGRVRHSGPEAGSAVMRCRSIVALLLFAALGVAACGSEAPAAESSLEQVRDMLRQRSQALTHGDVDGYLRPMTAAARAFEVPIAQFDLVFNPPADVSADAPAFTDVPVTATYRHTGLPDDNRFTIELLCSFARQDGSWLVTKSAPAS